MTNEDMALPQADRAVVPSGSSPSVSPVPASIPDADERLARELLAAEYENPSAGCEGPYPSYADLARHGRGAFTVCSIRAVMRGIEMGRAQAIETRSAETERLSPQGESAAIAQGDQQ